MGAEGPEETGRGIIHCGPLSPPTQVSIRPTQPPTPHPLPPSLLLGPALSFMFTLPMSPNPNGNLSFCLHQVTLFDGSFLERNKSL